MPVSELTGIGCYRKQYLSELVISVVRVEVGDAELASGLFDSPVCLTSAAMASRTT